MTKIVFFDFDKTLYSHNTYSVRDSVRVAINKLHKKGIVTCLATARGLIEIGEDVLPKDIKFDYYFLLNGQVIYDKDRKLIKSYPIDRSISDPLMKIYNENKYCMWVFELDDAYMNYCDDEIMEKLNFTGCKPVRIKNKYTGGDLYLISFVLKNGNQFNEIKQYLNDVNVLRVGDIYVDCVNKNVSKASAAQYIIDKLGIEQNETMSFGDSLNDVPLAQFSNISICMKDGEQGLKDIATYITDDVDHDGVYKALEKYNLI